MCSFCCHGLVKERKQTCVCKTDEMAMIGAFARQVKRGMARLKAREVRIVAGLFVITTTVFISCTTVNRVVVAPPNIPGAQFVGSGSCSQCHDDVTKNFKTADHARLIAKGANAGEMGCESCHGPGSLHNESGGERGTIINPRKNPETCFQCHLEKRGSFSLPHHHPLEDGKVSCVDCHNPHEGRMVKGGGTSLASSEETCFKCHTAQRGPFVFPHEAIREGCTVCHDPHGTVNQRMLISRNADLCLRCHFQQQLPGNTTSFTIGNVTAHATFLSRGTCWSGGCHEAVHGSQVNPHLRY